MISVKRLQGPLAIGAMMAVIFVIDSITGYEVALSIFYLIPISLATWNYSRGAGLFVSTVCAVLWIISETLSGRVYSNEIIPIWNMLVRLGFFVVVTVTLDARRRVHAELLAAREEAMNATRAKSDFVNRVTHELRTPLTAILGFAELLSRRAAPYLTPDDQSSLRRIRSNAESLLQMVDGVLNVGRVEAGKEPELMQVDLSDLLLTIERDMRARVDQSRVELIIDPPAELKLLQTDLYLLRQILLNLITNAIKFTADGYVRVNIETDSNAEPVKVIVEDTGIGIPEDRMQAIFEPFEQADSSIHRTYGGAGLGLSIAKDLSELLGYQLEVESTPGVGSRFILVLGQDHA